MPEARNAVPLISIVDDDESLRTALLGLVRSLGYRVSGFDSAEAFLASGPAPDTGCVITDIQMPGLSGFDLKRGLLERDRHVPVIMISARTDPGLHEKALASGAICLLKKPFEAAELIACIDRALAP